MHPHVNIRGLLLTISRSGVGGGRGRGPQETVSRQKARDYTIKLLVEAEI
jgi:hypothetical protein